MLQNVLEQQRRTPVCIIASLIRVMLTWYNCETPVPNRKYLQRIAQAIAMNIYCLHNYSIIHVFSVTPYLP